jgi:cytoskeleton protein RodZ
MKKVRSMSENDVVPHELSDTGVLDSGTRLNLGEVGQHNTAGALLREARQAQGLDIAALAALLKVPVQKLEALEQDQFDQLLDPAFARALAASMCRILKLDPAPVLKRLPAITAFKVTSQNRGINASFRARSGGHGASVWSHVSRPAVLVGLALLLGALILIFLPVIQQEIARYKQEGQGFATQSELVEPVSITTPLLTVAANSGASGMASNSPVEPLPPAEVPAFVSTPAVAPASLPAANAADVNANATITFSAAGESWVKVTDAKGMVALNRTLRAGESAGVSGALPLTTVVGRANAIQVQVRGQAFDLGGVTKNNVARFEVK